MLQTCHFEPRPLWKKADEDATKEGAKEICTFPKNISCISEINCLVDYLISWIKEVIDKHVPLTKLVTSCVPWQSEQKGGLAEKARRALGRHRWNPTELSWQQYLEANRAKGAAIRKAKRQCFEEAIEKACKQGGKSFWRLAK
jgi:hypothetical protein